MPYLNNERSDLALCLHLTGGLGGNPTLFSRNFYTSKPRRQVLSMLMTCLVAVRLVVLVATILNPFFNKDRLQYADGSTRCGWNE